MGDYEDHITDKKTGKGKEDGVVITDFDDFYEYEGTDTRVSVRRLVGSDEKLKEISNQILKLATKVVGKKYVLHHNAEDDTNKKYVNNWPDFWLLLQTKLPKSEWKERYFHDTYVCSTLDAHVLILAGVLNEKKHPDGDDIHWFPSDFAPSKLLTVTLGDEPKGDFNAGVSLGEE